jgi:hypothetical protein
MTLHTLRLQIREKNSLRGRKKRKIALMVVTVKNNAELIFKGSEGTWQH